jgi:hypothetical protein
MSHLRYLGILSALRYLYWLILHKCYEVSEPTLINKTKRESAPYTQTDPFLFVLFLFDLSINLSACYPLEVSNLSRLLEICHKFIWICVRVEFLTSHEEHVELLPLIWILGHITLSKLNLLLDDLSLLGTFVLKMLFQRDWEDLWDVSQSNPNLNKVDLQWLSSHALSCQHLQG